MNAQHTQFAAQEKPTYHFIVSPEQAERNQQAEYARKLAAKEAKAATVKYAEALRLDRARDRERAVAESAPMVATAVASNVFILPRKPVVVHTPTAEETEALRADIAHREEVRLKAVRRTEAERAKTNLLRWAEKTKPAISLFVQEVIGALFVHMRDERNAAVYACEGVEIRAYGAAVEAAPRNTKRVSRLSDEQQRAVNRRSHNKATMNASWAEAVKIMTTEVAKPARTAEERAAAKARNIEKMAGAKAAKDAAQAAYKKTHPKAKKAPVVKVKKGDKNKGGK